MRKRGGPPASLSRCRMAVVLKADTTVGVDLDWLRNVRFCTEAWLPRLLISQLTAADLTGLTLMLALTENTQCRPCATCMHSELRAVLRTAC